ncbi:MAG: diaminopimelate decarboxylase [Actinomycetota bacterium]|nr:diaminopimelate decarboxylase [Actinomycetota bacterium]
MSAPIDISLLPASARVDGATGRVSVGGCDLAELGERFGTPLYVYDEDDIRARCRAYRAQFPGGAAYASKAFLCSAMARVVAEEGMWIDVATSGELHVALNAGFPAERIVVHGNNKSRDELVRAVEAGVARIVVDSWDELDRLHDLARTGGTIPAVLVRATPGVEAHTHEHIETGVEDSKFGFGLDDGNALAAARHVVDRGELHFAGFHCHIGSQVFRLDSFERAVQKMAALIRQFERVTDRTVDECNVGGGLGVRYTTDDHAPTIEQYAATLHDAFAKAMVDVDARSRPRLMTEPGRSIAAPAGVTLYRVGTIKHVTGVRTYVAVDGGMSDNLRPMAYGAQYDAFVPARAAADRSLVVTIAGKHCEQGDLLVRDASVPADLHLDDILAVPVTGAYGHSLASNYNKVTRPAVVFVRDGEARVVVRRETDDDLVRLDQP